MQPGRSVAPLTAQFLSPLTMFRPTNPGLRTMPRIKQSFLLVLCAVPVTLLAISSLCMFRSNVAPNFFDLSSLPTSVLPPPMAPNPNLDKSAAELDQQTKERISRKFCRGINKQILKVFMYDLPPDFHFGLLGWTAKDHRTFWPDLRAGSGDVPQYPGGLNLQHSVEYWLTLDILSSEFSKNLSGRSAVRVHDYGEADVVFVPFFASISYNRFAKDHNKKNKNNRDKKLQEDLVKILVGKNEWKRSGGKDHIIVAHHPNSLLHARLKLWPALFILADFGRYPLTVANVHKDVIAPYKHLIPTFLDDNSHFDTRPILLYFQGAVYRKDGGLIRQELFYKLKDEKDVHFTFGTINNDGISQASKGMQSSKFCLNIAGDTPSSNRLFDSIASHCVPVIISDEIELPFEDVLDYTEFCVFVSTSDALKDKYLINFIRSITKEEWTKMWRVLKQVEQFFEFQYPSRENDAVQMIWQAISRKIAARKRMIHQETRLSRTTVAGDRKLITSSLPRNFW